SKTCGTAEDDRERPDEPRRRVARWPGGGLGESWGAPAAGEREARHEERLERLAREGRPEGDPPVASKRDDGQARGAFREGGADRSDRRDHDGAEMRLAPYAVVMPAAQNAADGDHDERRQEDVEFPNAAGAHVENAGREAQGGPECGVTRPGRRGV